MTLASRASLRRLNDWVAEGAVERGEPVPDPLPIERFRANVVVDGDLEPFVEDTWGTVRLGEVTFRVAKPVDRCVMTTIDLDSLGDRQGADPDARAPPPVGRRDVVRRSSSSPTAPAWCTSGTRCHRAEPRCASAKQATASGSRQRERLGDRCRRC